MNSLSSNGSASRLGMQALCVNLLFSLSPSAGAQPTLVHSSFSPWGYSDSPSLSLGGMTGGSLERFHSSRPLPGIGTLPRADGLRSQGIDCCDAEFPAEVVGAQGPITTAADSSDPTPTVLRATGAIESEVNLFRALLGDPNNGATPGQQSSGRREINWDGVPASLTNVPNFPDAFFNTNSPRGLVYDVASGDLEVNSQSFTDINPAYAGEFIPFSGTKLFSAVDTNQTDIEFFVAGSSHKAAVAGFGVVFVDVNKIGSTVIELLDVDGHKLGRFTAPVRSDRRGSSFIGVVFRNPVINRVHIIAGDAPLAIGEVDISRGGQHDLVVMDDFIYGEPTAIAP